MFWLFGCQIHCPVALLTLPDGGNYAAATKRSSSVGSYAESIGLSKR